MTNEDKLLNDTLPKGWKCTPTDLVWWSVGGQEFVSTTDGADGATKWHLAFSLSNDLCERFIEGHGWRWGKLQSCGGVFTLFENGEGKQGEAPHCPGTFPSRLAACLWIAEQVKK